jgi:hypothetical protein
MMTLKKNAAVSFASLRRETRIKRDTIQRLGIQFIVAAIIAIIAATVLLKGRSQLQRKIEGTTRMAANQPKLTFRQVAVSDGKTPEGASFTEQHYKASDCAAISRTIVSFGSQDRAFSEVQAEAKRASKIVDRKSVLDAHQVSIGERVVMEFVEPQGVSYAKIAWNQRAEYTSIVAPSLYYIQDFEKAAESPSHKEFFFGMDSV